MRKLNLRSCGDEKIHDLKPIIEEKLEEYSMVEDEVNTGQIEDEYSMSVHAAFNKVEESKEFHSWLEELLLDKQYQEEETDEDGEVIQEEVEVITSAEIRAHDCWHGTDRNYPCKLGDIQEVI